MDGRCEEQTGGLLRIVYSSLVTKCILGLKVNSYATAHFNVATYLLGEVQLMIIFISAILL